MDARSDGVVVLARFGPDDASAQMEADGDPEHRRRFSIPPDFVPSVVHAQQVIARWIRDYDD